MSMISSSYRPARCSSQRAVTFVMASEDRGVIPDTYNLKTNFAASRALPAFSNDRFAESSLFLAIWPPLASRPEVQAYENTFGVGQIPDDLANRHGQFSHQRGHRNDL